MEMGDIYGLLRYLGLSAESTRFFYVSYAVYLTTRQPARTPFAEWWLCPAVAGHYHTCIFGVFTFFRFRRCQIDLTSVGRYSKITLY